MTGSDTIANIDEFVRFDQNSVHFVRYPPFEQNLKSLNYYFLLISRQTTNLWSCKKPCFLAWNGTHRFQFWLQKCTIFWPSTSSGVLSVFETLARNFAPFFMLCTGLQGAQFFKIQVFLTDCQKWIGNSHEEQKWLHFGSLFRKY